MANGMRFQSGLGSEFERRYKEGQQVNTLMLAQVIQVNYKYNTVDVIALQHKEVLQNSYANEGKYSARLPLEFGGRNIYGQPYGQVNPIAVGTVVLIGFIDGSKNQPIVLGVYGDSSVSNKLSRTPFSNADPNDEDLARHTYQKFSLYPSLTYDSVDGNGNRVVTFSGRSFIAIDSNGTKNSAMTDASYGTNYEDLEQSYYKDGELIEPMKGRAPNILFKHQGVLDDDEEPDTHKLMLHIAPDGTYRTSMLDEEQDWRTLFEMTPDGGVRLRRQGDSIGLIDGFEVGEIGISKTGQVYMRNGEMDLEVREDGIYSQGKPLTASADLTEVYERLAEQDGKLVQMSTSLTMTDEKVQILANKTEYFEGQIVDFEASLTIMADMIESKVSEARVEELIDASMRDFTEEIAKVQADADRANKVIADMADDNRITPQEKKDLLPEWDLIKNEYPTYIAQAELYGVSSDKYTASYNAVQAFVEPILADMDSTSIVDGVIMRRVFGTYYSERTAILNAILKDLKDGIIEAMKIASQASVDATTALADATQAQIDANKANALIDDIASDGMVTGSEKSQLKKEWAIIQREYPTTIAQADKYDIDTADYTAKYNALNAFITPILADMSVTSVVDGDQLRAVFSNYYATRVTLLKEISDTAKDILTDYGGRIYVAETSIQQTSEQIALLATKVETIGTTVETHTAELIVHNELISQKVTASEVKGIVQEEIDGLSIGGSNNFVYATSAKGYLSDTDGTVGAVVDDSIVSTFIKVKQKNPYVASLYDNNRANVIVIAWYDTNKTFISGQTTAGTDDFYQAYVSPDNAVYARVCYKYATTVKIKFEVGTKPTDFSYAWEDIKDDQDKLNEYIKQVEAEAKKAQADAENAKNQADVANEAIADMSNDNIVSPAEKQQLLLQWEEIKTEYPLNTAQASKFGVSYAQYTSAYNALKAYIEPILADMTTNSVIVGSTMRSIFNTYYDRRTTLLNDIATVAKTLADNAQKSADKLDDDLNNIGGYNYVGFSSANNMYPRLMIDNVGYYNIMNSVGQFEEEFIDLIPDNGASNWYYDIGTSSTNVAKNGLASYRLGDIEVGKWLTFSANIQSYGNADAGVRLQFYIDNGSGWSPVNGEVITPDRGMVRATVQTQIKSTSKAILLRIIPSNMTATTKVRFNKVQLEVGIRPTPWKKSDIDITEDINNAVSEGIDNIQMYTAWANSSDGTVDFTKVYPNDNLAGSNTFDKWSTVAPNSVDITKEKVTISSNGANYVGFCTWDFSAMKPDTDYVFSYKIKLTSGSMSRIGGHLTVTYSQVGNVTVNGIELTGNYATQGIASNFVVGETYKVVVKLHSNVDLTTGIQGVFVQPNRTGFGEAYTAEVTEIKLEEGAVNTPFVTANSDDPAKAKMLYTGTGLKDSNDPKDYTWTLSSEYVDNVAKEGLNGKEGAWIYQPTAPENPAIGVVWVDTSVTPNQPKRWTGTDTGWVPLTPEEVKDLPWGEDGSNLADWVAQAEQRITADSIINTVLGSENFTSIFDSKANAEDLTNLANYDDLESMQEEYARLLKEGIDGIDFSPYVTNTELEQLKDSFNFTVQQAGGVNMLRNSLGFSGLDFWDGATGENLLPNSTWNFGMSSWVGIPAGYTEILPPEADKPTSSILHLMKSTSGSQQAYQRPHLIEVKKGETYTVSFDIKLGTYASTTMVFCMRLFENPTISQSQANSIWYKNYSNANLGITSTSAIGKFQRVSATVTMESDGWLNIIPYSNSTTGTFESWYREFKFEKGTQATDWTPASADGISGDALVTTTQNNELAKLGFGSGFMIDHRATAFLQQTVTLPEVASGLKYAVSGYINITASGTVTGLKASIRVLEDGVVTYTTGITAGNVPVGYNRYAIIFEPQSQNITIELSVENGTNATVIMSGIMFNIGTLALKWQPYPSEIYNTNVQIDINGITVKNNQTDGYTLITPKEFSGYARVGGEMERIFTLNGEVTEVKMLQAEQRITMEPISIFAMNTDVNKGWAFVSSLQT